MNEVRLEIEDIESSTTLYAYPSSDGAVIGLSDDGADLEISLDLDHLGHLLNILNHIYDDALEAQELEYALDCTAPYEEPAEVPAEPNYINAFFNSFDEIARQL